MWCSCCRDRRIQTSPIDPLLRRKLVEIDDGKKPVFKQKYVGNEEFEVVTVTSEVFCERLDSKKTRKKMVSFVLYICYI